MSHPSELALLELARGRAEVSDLALTRAHVLGGDPADAVRGCEACACFLGQLETLAAHFAEEHLFDTDVDTLPATGGGSPSAGALAASLETAAAAAAGLVDALPDEAALESGIRAALARPHGSLAVTLFCQEAAKLVAKDPRRTLAAARLVSLHAHETRALAEAALLEAQSLTVLGRCGDARGAVARARSAFALEEDPFAGALCDYFDGSAASFAGEYEEAEALVTRAAAVFDEFGQADWVGRAEAALATLHAQTGRHRLAQAKFEAALARLDPELDAGPFAATLVNKASSLVHQGREAEAVRVYAKALSHARRFGFRHTVHAIREGLAELELRSGRLAKALSAYERLAHAARQAGFAEDVALAELYVAECLLRLGRVEEARRVLDALRPGAAPGSPAFQELFSCLDRGELDAGLVAHVRSYTARAGSGRVLAYRPFRRAAG